LKKILLILLFCIVSLDAKINSYVTILPQKYFIQQIVSDKITIRSMLKNHDNISIYKPKIKQLNTIKKYINIYFTFNLKWEKRYINDFKI
jgi:ABC-type Zn uptake system ZnuABC Zn-binding protein ZnuA